MKFFLSIIILGLFLNPNISFAEKIVFSDCAGEKDNFIFNPEIWEKNEVIIDTSKKTVSSILIKSNEFLDKNKNADKYFIFGPDNLSAIIEGYAVRELYYNGELRVKITYDLKRKTYEYLERGKSKGKIYKCK